MKRQTAVALFRMRVIFDVADVCLLGFLTWLHGFKYQEAS